MEFRVLGHLEIVKDGKPVSLGSHRQRVLLAALLARHGAVASADRLIDILWEDAPPETALATLRTYVSRLRGALGGDASPLETRPPGYLLRVASEQVDATRFESLVYEARRLLADDPAQAESMLSEALSLWRGPAYAEFAEYEFARGEAARLEELRATALEELANAKMLQGRHEEVVGDLEALAAERPLSQRPRLLLATALYRCGRHAEALEACRSYTKLLDEELGLEPPPAIANLERDILQQSPSLDWRPNDATAAPVDQPEAGPRSAAPARGNLPLEVAGFFGREVDVAGIAEGLRRSRLLTLTGTGGVGKSRLSLHVARRVAEGYPDGAWICELASVTDPEAVPYVMAAALGIQEQPGRRVEDTMVDSLRHRNMLLIVDNCEQVVEAVGRIVEALLQRCPGVTVLATGRERLSVPGEQAWPVSPLPLPDVVDVRAAGASPSVALFVDRASAVSPGFTLGEHNVRDVVRICRELDGLPLGVELAAACARSLGPEEIASRLNERFSLLRLGHRGGDGRHRTLQAAVDWSYALLDEREKRLFERLSVFAGGFTLEHAEGVCDGDGVEAGEVAGLLARLVDASLVTADTSGSSTRYVLLETLRSFAEVRLSERGDAHAWRRRHAQHFAAIAEEVDRLIRGPEEARGVEMAERELDNLRAAFSWAMDQGDVDVSLRIPAALFFFARWRMRFEFLGWAETAAERFAASGHPILPIVYGAASVLASYGGDRARGKTLAESGIAAAAGPDDAALAYPLHALAEIAIYEGRLEDGKNFNEQALRLARGIGDSYMTASILTDYALACAYDGQTQRANELAREVAAIADKTGSPTWAAWALYVQGEALLDEDAAKAIELMEQAAENAAAGLNSFTRAVSLVSATSLRARHGHPEQALQAFLGVITHWREAGDWTHQWVTLRNLLDLFLRLEHLEAAATLHGAVTSAQTAAPAFGSDAARLAEQAASLESHMGTGAFRDAISAGASMTPEEAVERACAEIRRLLGERG